MITMTCLIGVVVLLSPVWANSDTLAVSEKNAKEASPLREHCKVLDISLLKGIYALVSLAGSDDDTSPTQSIIQSGNYS